MDRIGRAVACALACAALVVGCSDESKPSDGGSSTTATTGTTGTTGTTASTTSTTRGPMTPPTDGETMFPDFSALEGSLDFSSETEVSIGAGLRLGSCGKGDAMTRCLHRQRDVPVTFHLSSAPVRLTKDPMKIATSATERLVKEREAPCKDKPAEPVGPSGAKVAGKEGATYGVRVNGRAGRVDESATAWVVVEGETIWTVTVYAWADVSCFPHDGPQIHPPELDAGMTLLEPLVAGMRLPEAAP